MSDPIDPRTIPSRRWAGPFDISIEEGEATGAGRDDDAIGGYRGISCYSFYRDFETGEIYKVRCSDGVDFGKGSHEPEVEEWLSDYYYAIVARTLREVAAGAAEVRISRHERALMQGSIMRGWLDEAAGANNTYRNHEGLGPEGGLVGRHEGVPIIVDPAREDEYALLVRIERAA